MRRVYNLLKQSENYNIIIGAVLLSAIVLCIYTVISFIVSIIAMGIQGILTDNMGFMISGLIWDLSIGVFSIIFSVLACRKSPKFILVFVTGMIVLSLLTLCIYSLSLHYAIMGTYWYLLVRRAAVDVNKSANKIIIILIILSLIELSYALWFDMVFTSDTTLVEYINYSLGKISEMLFNPEFFLAFLLYKEMKKPAVHKTKTVIVSLIIWAITMVATVYSSIYSFVEMKDWYPPITELEEGDWSEWTTEEDLKKLEEPDWGENQ